MEPKTLAAWRAENAKAELGVIVGADITQEWLLPWWWERYRKHNAQKVAFVDFGMSFEKKDWCERRGELIPLRIFDDFVQEKSAIDPALGAKWESMYGKDFWDSRTAWFKKPFACLQTPFLKTVWIDIDCEIRGSIEPLFAYADEPPRVAMAREQCKFYAPYPLYNSGVISFRHGAKLINEWALLCIERNAIHRGDEDVFAHMLEQKKISIAEIPPPYNWSRCQKDKSQAIILHWHGTCGKEALRREVHLSALSEV